MVQVVGWCKLVVWGEGKKGEVMGSKWCRRCQSGAQSVAHWSESPRCLQSLGHYENVY